MKLEEKLKCIRISYEMSRKELSKYIEIPVKDITAFEKGKKIPNDLILKKIANEFNTSVHFLKNEKHNCIFNAKEADFKPINMDIIDES